MRHARIFALALIAATAGLAAPVSAQNAPMCQSAGFPAEWGISSTGYFVIPSGTSCMMSVNLGGQVTASGIAREPAHGRLQAINLSTFLYSAPAGFTGTDNFAIQATGNGPSSAGTSTISLSVTVQ